jgi:hypothetical protein
VVDLSIFVAKVAIDLMRVLYMWMAMSQAVGEAFWKLAIGWLASNVLGRGMGN